MNETETAAALSAALVASMQRGEPFIEVAFRLAIEMNKSGGMAPEEFRKKSSGFSAKLISELTGKSVNTINRYRSSMKAPPDVAAVVKTLNQLRGLESEK